MLMGWAQYARRNWQSLLFILGYGLKRTSMLLKTRKIPHVPLHLPLQGTSTDGQLRHVYRQFQDSQTASWPTTPIVSLLEQAFASSLATTPSSKAPTASIDVLITFDASGVSGHPNHISLYHGAREFLRRLTKRHPGWECPVTLYTLRSVGIGRKYLGPLDAVVTMLGAAVGRLTGMDGMGRGKGKGIKKGGDQAGLLLFVSGIGGWRRAQTAMVQAHASQMRWFRWGWIGSSRYMVVNDLRVEKVR
jgi:N-acetylglucosaminylphosphatidylinositol deacetylase